MTTIARPYATAAFEYALAHNDLSAWEIMLLSAANITSNADVARLLSSPKVTIKQLADMYCELLASQLNEARKNFILLLAKNERLVALPAMATAFQLARAAQEKTMQVDVISAAKLEDAYLQKLVKALTVRLQRHVELRCQIDPSLLGGAIIRAGDMVIDGSIRGKLTRLNEFI